ncbi:vWA domain-containing protein [Pararhodospirillum photometricum]|nr:VWA domain-containing protein [Pararhodospirillum photometricum]
MFLRLFLTLREARLPVSLTEYLMLLDALDARLAFGRVDDFYHLARATLIKDERHFDRFDQVFGQVFRGLETLGEALAVGPEARALPEDWLRSLGERFLTPEEKAQVAALGGFEALMETLRQRLEEQKKRHAGGGKWIGTQGTSPFGADGYNPEGVRIGQDRSRHRRALKVWDRREFRDLDGDTELGPRAFKLALRRLRTFARTGAATELDLEGTIHATAHQGGLLDVKMVPERHNAVKVLLLLDSGGSMDDHVGVCESLFRAARAEFKHLETFYFHNCVYESLWRSNARRHAERTPTALLLNTYPRDYRLILVGDAAMSPSELTRIGGSVEHMNAEPGQVWVARLLEQWPRAVWLNPVPERFWGSTASTALVHRLMGQRMYPLTLTGLDVAMTELVR